MKKQELSSLSPNYFIAKGKEIAANKSTVRSCKGDGCFIAGTLISTIDGKCVIEHIKKGDRVWACDIQIKKNVSKSIKVNTHKSIYNKQKSGKVCTFHSSMSVKAFVSRSCSWVLTQVSKVAPGSEIVVRGQLYRIRKHCVSEKVAGVDESHIIESDKPYNLKSYKWPIATDVVQVLDKEMAFSRHAVLNSLYPGIRICFQGKVYELRKNHGKYKITLVDTGIVSCAVEEAYKRDVKTLVDLTIRDNNGKESVISGTTEHPFYVPACKNYVELSKLKPGMVLQTLSGTLATVISSKIRTGDFDVYNFKVPEMHNYYVSSGGLRYLVHNVDCGTSGGTYKLVDPDTKTMMKSGRTNNLHSRELAHARNPVFKDFEFKSVHNTDNPNELRGLEEVVYGEGKAPYDKIRPISPNNKNIETYRNAAQDYLERNK